MNFDATIATYNGKVLNDYDGECVSLIAHYSLDNGKPIVYANAKDWWNHPALTGAFDFIINNPSDYKQVPPRGAIVIWNGALAGSKGFGHIAIFDAVVSPGVFRSLDNNWGGRYVHFVTHNWNNVIGWMIPKSNTPIGGAIMIPNKDIATKLYKMLRPNAGGSSAEIDATAGKRYYDEFINSGQAEIAIRDANLKAVETQMINIQSFVNEQNVVITKLTSDVTLSKADKAKLIAQIADCNAEIATAHDKIKDLETNQTKDTLLLNEGKGFFGFITKLIERLKK